MRWQCYFWQQLADAFVIKDSQADALHSLEQGMQVASEPQLLDQQVGAAGAAASVAAAGAGHVTWPLVVACISKHWEQVAGLDNTLV